VIKAWKRIFELLECVYQHPFDRKGFQEAVLNLYGNVRSSKSVFRGLAIPTLRSLGYILGYADLIRASANGTLVHVAHEVKLTEGFRALRATLLEIDDSIGILHYLCSRPALALGEMLPSWTGVVETSEMHKFRTPAARSRAAQERLTDWIRFLDYAQLLYMEGDQIRVDAGALGRARQDLDPKLGGKARRFVPSLLRAYKRLVHQQAGNRDIEINSIRTQVAVDMYQELGALFTEHQFDILLSETPKTTRQYSLSFGRSMGAEEKLFTFNGKYYQTISIRDLRQKGA
jgi:hypothetical protein